MIFDWFLIRSQVNRVSERVFNMSSVKIVILSGSKLSKSFFFNVYSHNHLIDIVFIQQDMIAWQLQMNKNNNYIHILCMIMCHFYIYKEIYKYMFSKAAFNSPANHTNNNNNSEQNCDLFPRIFISTINHPHELNEFRKLRKRVVSF